MNSSLIQNELGGITYAPQQRIGQPEHRSGVLAELRMTLDALGDTREHHRNARATIMQLLDMLEPDAAAAELRTQLMADLEKIDAVLVFNDYIIQRVRGGAFKRMAELFDK